MSFEELSKMWLRFLPQQWIFGQIGMVGEYDAAFLLQAAFPDVYDSLECRAPVNIPSFIASIDVSECIYVITYSALPVGLESGNVAEIGESIEARSFVPICLSKEKCFRVPVTFSFTNRLHGRRPYTIELSPDPIPDDEIAMLRFTHLGRAIPEEVTCRTTPELGQPGKLGNKYLFLEETENCQFVIYDLGKKYAHSYVDFYDSLGRKFGTAFIEETPH